MPVTIITNPTLVVDISQWDPMIKPQELIDGGVTDVILKIGGGITEDPMFRENGCLLAQYNKLRLHGYWWDDPIYDPGHQVDQMTKIIQSYGLPILSVWADQEQWWSDWNLWGQAKAGKLAWGKVPVFKPLALDSHYHNFANTLVGAFPNSGVYTGRGFITSYVPTMKYWLFFFKSWFSQYGHQPAAPTQMSWQTLKSSWMPDYDPNILDTGLKPENIVGHQFTGDVCRLPGSYYSDQVTRVALDVSAFRADFMENLAGGSQPKPTVPITPPDQPIPNVGQAYIFLGSFLWVLATPTANPKLVDSLTHDQRVNVLEIQGKYARIDKPAGWVELAWLTKV
jgi:hypothetical protein